MNHYYTWEDQILKKERNIFVTCRNLEKKQILDTIEKLIVFLKFIYAKREGRRD